MKVLSQDFFLTNDTPTIAQLLLGKIIIHETEAGSVAGRIVETEAYLSYNDPASHSARGLTRANASMFGPGGQAYVYISYGIHHCFNTVCQEAGKGEGVLIRALEPLLGLSIMRQRRPGHADSQLTNGPGKLCQALGIDLDFNGHDLNRPPLYLVESGYEVGRVGQSPRIGISKGRGLPLRFYIAGNKFVSRPPRT